MNRRLSKREKAILFDALMLYELTREDLVKDKHINLYADNIEYNCWVGVEIILSQKARQTLRESSYRNVIKNKISRFIKNNETKAKLIYFGIATIVFSLTGIVYSLIQQRDSILEYMISSVIFGIIFTIIALWYGPFLHNTLENIETILSEKDFEKLWKNKGEDDVESK